MNWKSAARPILGGLLLLAMSGVPAAYAAPPSGCSMLAPAQIQKTVGQPFGAPKETKAPPAYGKQPWGAHCEYNSRNAPDVTVTFIVYVDASASQAKQTFDMLSMWFPAKSKEAIGDAAYIDKEGAIHVLKGKVRYFISIDPANEKKLKDLATAVAAGI
jgi:hypothetical protein